MTIRVLSPETALKIAAGEVIERPASIVKELVENSIDAGAKNIRVEIKNGGLAYLRIADDGCGIAYEEVPIAFERHATSKITAADDLYDLHTLGFRGEALPSIAAVSQMTMLTRSRQEGENGSEIAFEGGKLIYHRPAGAPSGTVITVRNLFYNLPARQKWSRSGSSEAGHILTIVNNYALAYPEVKFALVSDGRLILQTSGNGDLKDVVAQVMGQETAQAMLQVDSHPSQVDNDGVISDDSATAKIRVSGLTAEPKESKTNRNFMLFFVNRRWIVSRTLSYAVQEAYHSLLTTGRHPICALMIEVDPAEIDANVHPAKTEVRFLHERKVFGAVQAAVRAALLARAGGTVWEAPDPLIFAKPEAQLMNNIFTPTADVPVPTKHIPKAQATWSLEEETDDSDLLIDETAYSRARANAAISKEVAKPVQASEPALKPLIRIKTRLPLLRVLGQMANVYLVCEGPDGMYLLDQHAAHERIMYERFQGQLEGRKLDSQLILEPTLVNLSARQRLALQDEQKRVELAEIGFELEYSDEAVWLKAIPTALLGRDLKLSLAEMLDDAEGLRDNGCEVGHEEQLIGDKPRLWRDRLAASLACHSAIRAGQILTLEEMRELISQLERTSQPNACAHGRPTIMHLSQGQLEKGFGRR